MYLYSYLRTQIKEEKCTKHRKKINLIKKETMYGTVRERERERGRKEKNRNGN